MSSTASFRSKNNSSPETAAGAAAAMQDQGTPQLRLRQQRQRRPQRISCHPAPSGGSNEEEERQLLENRLQPDSGLKLRRRFRKRRSNSPLDPSGQAMTGRTVKFHKLFDIPSSEVLIRKFPCALKAEILLQGTFYASANYFCFYARLANKRKTIKIPIRSVCEITRERTAIFFPNAIGIRTEDIRYVFGSILSRESTLKLLLELWKVALTPQQNGGQTTSQSIDSVRRIFRSSSDSDLMSLQLLGTVPTREHLQNGTCPAAATATAAAAPHLHRHHHRSAIGGHQHHEHHQHHQHHQHQPQQLLADEQELQLQAGQTAALVVGDSADSGHQVAHQSSSGHHVLGGSADSAAVSGGGLHWSDVILQFVIFLKCQLSFIIADNRMILGCSLIVLCLAYVLYLAYQIHMIQQTISERLEELLQSSAILSPLVQR